MPLPPQSGSTSDALRETAFGERPKLGLAAILAGAERLAVKHQEAKSGRQNFPDCWELLSLTRAGLQGCCGCVCNDVSMVENVFCEWMTVPKCNKW